MKDSETARFFDGRESAWPLYEALEKRLVDLFPAVRRKVQKTQISFSNRRMFVCASFARVKRKAELPDPYLVVTLGALLPAGLRTDRGEDGAVSGQVDHAHCHREHRRDR